MKKRSVVFVLNSTSRLGGGVAEAVRLQALCLHEADLIDISVLALRDRYSTIDRGPWKDVDIRSFRPWGPARFGFSPVMLLSLLARKPDIVHVHGVWQFHCLVVWIWTRLTGRPYVVSPHGMLERWIRARSPRQKALISRLYHDAFLKKSDGIHLLTEKERDDVEDVLTGQPTSVIVNYVAGSVDDGVKPSWWRPDFDSRRIFLFFGRIHEKKGCLELCHAWAKACEADRSFQDGSALVFCGWNDGIESFEHTIADVDARFGNIVYAGPQYGAAKQHSLHAADLLILPSKSEGLPMAILEAWEAGLAVMMTPECNLPEGFAEGAAIEIGFCVDNIVPALLAAHAMNDLQLQAMGAAGAKIVLERYSEQAVKPKLLSFYEAAKAYRLRAPESG